MDAALVSDQKLVLGGQVSEAEETLEAHVQESTYDAEEYDNGESMWFQL